MASFATSNFFVARNKKSHETSQKPVQSPTYNNIV